MLLRRAPRFAPCTPSLEQEVTGLISWQSLKADWEKNPGDAYPFAPIYARLGDKDNAFKWLDKAYQERSQGVTLSLLIEQAFGPGHFDPRYHELLRRIGRDL